ncbi:ABC transporter substrate-binding protein [Brevibacterium linens]|uniref:ABC transporter substrate-binding protein n=1 Tax=Brevibacterium linens TaxID=1703 RepID=UPI003BF612C1
MNKTSIIAMTASVALGLTACAGGSGDAANDADAITIGSVHPLSGALAGVGAMMNDGAQLAVDDINEAGGISSQNGAELKLSEGDSQGQAQKGQSEAQRLISEGAAALVGTYQSDTTQNVASVAERSKVPLVIDVAVDDKILSQGYKNVFRIQPDASSMGQSGAQDLLAMAKASDTKVKKISYIHIEGAFGSSVFEAFKKEAEADGVEIAAEVTYSGEDFSDATTQVAKALAAKPDVVAVTGYYPDNLLVAKALKAANSDVKGIYGIASGAFDDSSFPNDGGDAATNVLSANYHYSATSERVSDIRKRFEEKYDKPMETAAILSYQAVEVIAEGLEDSGSDDPAELRDAISKLSLDDPLLAFDGPIKFDERGQNENATVIVMQVQDGEIKQVFPEKFAEESPVFPVNEG